MTDDTHALIRNRVLAEQVAVIYRQAHTNALISVVVGGVVCLILRDVTPARDLWAWWGALCAMAAVRIGLWFAYRNSRTATEAVKTWERRFLVSLFVTAAVWGFGALWVTPSNAVAQEAAVYFFLMGMVSGALATYAAHFVGVTATIWLVLFPLSARFAFSGEPLLGAMAFGGVLFSIAAFRATRMLEGSLLQSFQLAHELGIANARAETMARTDELTGLSNRRAFRAQLDELLAQARRYGQPLSLVMVDLDHFKRVNDTHGHGVGDEALRMLASVLRQVVREADAVGRWGGEEFALALPQTTTDEAMHMAERVRVALEQARVAHAGGALGITASFGVATAGKDATADALLATADAAMYRAKSEGRNRVVQFEPLLAGVTTPRADA